MGAGESCPGDLNYKTPSHGSGPTDKGIHEHTRDYRDHHPLPKGREADERSGEPFNPSNPRGSGMRSYGG